MERQVIVASAGCDCFGFVVAAFSNGQNASRHELSSDSEAMESTSAA